MELATAAETLEPEHPVIDGPHLVPVVVPVPVLTLFIHVSQPDDIHVLESVYLPYTDEDRYATDPHSIFFIIWVSILVLSKP